MLTKYRYIIFQYCVTSRSKNKNKFCLIYLCICWKHVTGMSLGEKKISDTFFWMHNLSQLGVWGRCKPPSGARGGAPEANAYWQQSTENFVLLYNFIIIYLYKCTKQLVFPRSYITKRKIGHSFRRLGNPPS